MIDIRNSESKKTSLHLALLLLVYCMCAAAQAATLKIATQLPDGTDWMVKIRAAGDRIAERTDERVKLKFYPGGVMGNDSTVLRKMRIGQLHGAALTAGEFSRIQPDVLMYTIPFLFEDRAEVEQIRQHFDEKLRTDARALGYELAGMSGGGFAYMMSTQKSLGLDALRDLKTWLPQDDKVAAIGLEIARIPAIQLPLSDVFTGLQTGMLEAVATSTAGAIAFQWHSKLHAIMDMPISYIMAYLVMDKRSLDKLSDADRAVVLEELDTTFDALERGAVTDNAEALEALKSRGMNVEVPSAEERDAALAIGKDTLQRLQQEEIMEFNYLDELLQQLEQLRASED